MPDQPTFQREHRYYVFKRKHLTPQQEALLQSLSEEIPDYAQPTCVVVESDWPIYEKVWSIIHKIWAKSQPDPTAALGHVTRYSDSSLYDEICTLCKGTDASGDNSLSHPCTGGQRF